MSAQAALKKALRAQYRQWMRDAVSQDFALKSGEAVLSHLQKLPKPRKVSVFVSKYPEISTFPLIRWLFAVGVDVYLPAWHSEEMWMCRVENESEFTELVQNTKDNKIPMPCTGRIECKDLEYDWIIMPGLVFEGNRHRLGYGYGHYDYFLSRYFSCHDRSTCKTKLSKLKYLLYIFIYL